jgi:O-antigen/teichoic acid export membrane protein
VTIVRRLGWGVADQVVSSISNFVLGIVVARSLGAHGFGSFSLAFVTYTFILSASRGLSTDPLLVRFSGPESPEWRRAVSASCATAAGIGAAAGAGCVIVGLVLPGHLGGSFVALGIFLPALLLQDSWRFAFFAVGRPVQALVNDLVWGGALVAALGMLLITDEITAVTCVAAFGATAAVAAGFGYLQCRIRPAAGRVGAWLFDHRSLGARYFVENLASGASRQIRFIALGALAGLATVGTVRGAELLMGPFLVMLMGVSQVAVPEASHVLSTAPTKLARFCVSLGGSLALGAGLWGLFVLVVLPMGLGSLLLGPIWPQAEELLPALVVWMCMAGFVDGASSGLRALGASPRSLAAQLITMSAYVVGSTVGVLVAGAVGSCWGVAIATTLGALVWWYQLRRALDEHHLVPDATADLSSPLVAP